MQKDPTNNVQRAVQQKLQDVKEARIVVVNGRKQDVLRESNPHHGPSWISGAKLEESCGRLNEARNIIRRACNACPNDEEVWQRKNKQNTAFIVASVHRCR